MLQKTKGLFCICFYAFNSLASTVELEWQHYTSAPILKTQGQDYALLKWDQEIDYQTSPFYFDSHFKVELSLDKSQFTYFTVPELYVSYRYDLKQPLYFIESIEGTLGRRIKNWSLADEYWDMSLWNFSSLWNPLHPVSEGLIGAFLTFNAHRWSVESFAGALYLPNQEIKILKKDGRLYSHSRWFFPTYRQVDRLKLNIDYSIDDPFIFDVLFQPSYLLSLKTWSKTMSANYWIKLSMADKPVNYKFFVLSQTRLFNIGRKKGSVGVINQSLSILPVRQSILSVEWGLDYKNFSAVFTVESIKTQEDELSPKGWGFLYQRENFNYFSSLLKYAFQPENFIQLAYIQSWFKDGNHLSGRETPFIFKKYKVLGGLGLDWQTKILSSKNLPRIFTLNFRKNFFNENKGEWLFVRFLYYITSDIYTEVTADILGGNRNEDYLLNMFRHNDYFSLGLGYDF